MHHTFSDRWNSVSLRTKITGVTVLMLTLGLLVSGFGTTTMLRSYMYGQTDDRLKSVAQGDLAQYLTTQLDGNLEIRRNASEEVYVALYSPSGEFVGHNWAKHHETEWPLIPKTLTFDKVSNLTPFDLADNTGEAMFRAVEIVVSDSVGQFATAIVAVPMSDTHRLLAAYLSIFFGFGVGVIIVGALITRMLVTSTFTPLREVEATAAAIADGDFSQRLGGATPNTEVGRLNRSLNTMLNRIDRAFRDRARTIEQMRRFVGDASHELRTPLVSVRGYAELYRMGALQSPEEVAQAMERIEKEAIRMGGLVEDLLELARLDETKPLQLAPVDLVPLARDAALDATAISPGRTITVVTPPPIGVPVVTAAVDAVVPEVEPTPETSAPSPKNGAANTTGPISFAGATIARLRGRRPRRENEPVTPATGTPVHTGEIVAPPHEALVLAEENKIRQVITNLMGNAMRFTPDDAPIEIRITVDHGTERATLEVVDHGEGIPLQIREKIFQRFWRADSSRARETGGSGLGLAIVSSIVAAHNGLVDVVETPGGGATFRVSLPLADSAAAPQSIATR
ncbi:HAMP domain-containing histidine kinase [Agromyces atrinae]|uniref:sensor histidine kinase n=1 Tax=Agromyces atrinae TaxID=592376 RepID=UPI001F580CFB|nr:HAMP domain-containing sensor histidine kinase [Agromyces atrinae]MCI2959580.1 HAMP domain-containing histidine kinase [Agromyces atrinae]